MRAQLNRDDYTVHRALTPEELRTLSASRTKLEILLNPDEGDTVALLKLLDETYKTEIFGDRQEKSNEMLAVARRLLKREWVRIKNELNPTN